MFRAALVLCCLAAAFAPAAPIPKTKVKDTEAIQGQWKVVELTHDGKPADNDYQGSTATLDKDTFQVQEPKAKRDEKMSYKIDPDKKSIELSPKGVQLDITMLGIYELDGDTLTIAIAMGAKGESPKEVKSGPGVAFLKLQRIKEEKK